MIPAPARRTKHETACHIPRHLFVRYLMRILGLHVRIGKHDGFPFRPPEAEDRAMRAYSKTRDLTEQQAAVARKELSKFIDELMFGTVKQPDQDGQTSNGQPTE